MPNPEEKREKKDRKGKALGRRRQERRMCNEMVVKACLLVHIMDPFK